MHAKPVVEVENLCVKFGDFYAVKDVSFTVTAGEVFGFLGANGAGKTTTIRVLCGLLRPSAGLVRIAGADYAAGEAAIKTRVGYMSQKFTLYNDMTVAANLDFTAALRKIAPKIYRERRRRLLEFISFADNLNTKVRDLPGGIKQQVSLVAALLHEPDIIFLDEPTAGVTPASRAKFWDLIGPLQAEGKTIFVTTHYMDEAENCGRIALMRSGELIALDTPHELKVKTFPNPIYELEPLRPLHEEALRSFQSDGALSSFLPYGIRFHAIVKSQALWDAAAPRFAEKFAIRPVEPSLEDVFIELVEGRKSP